MGHYFVVGNCYDFSGQYGSVNKIQFKSKLSKASQEVVLQRQRHLLLKNEKKKMNKDNLTNQEEQILVVTERSVDTNSGENKIFNILLKG